MKFIYYPTKEEVEKYYGTDETMMMLVSYDGKSAVVSPSIETYEHHTLLAQAGIRETDIDKYFRIVFDNVAADWTFVCPQDYRKITESKNVSRNSTRTVFVTSRRLLRKLATSWSYAFQSATADTLTS